MFGTFVVFHFDLTGYDKWVPNPEKVESIAIDIPALQNTGYYDVEEDCWINSADYIFEHMTLTDTENICAFVESVLTDQIEDNEMHFWVNIKYNMKNGSEKYRSICFSLEKHIDELNTIVTGKEYQKVAYQMLDEQFNSRIKLKNIEFGNGIWSKEIEAEDIEMVYENYKEDLVNYDLETIVNEYPIGILYFEFEIPGTFTEGIRSCSMPVYASFEKTVAYANENKCLVEWITPDFLR